MTNDTMSAEEIVRGLYLCAAGGQTAVQTSVWCAKAADLIESQTAEIAELQGQLDRINTAFDGFDPVETLDALRKEAVEGVAKLTQYDQILRTYQSTIVPELRSQLAAKTDDAEMYRILRADADRIREGLMERELELIHEKMELENQLVASQQETRAAVECIEEIAYQNRKFHETWIENAIDEWRGKIERKD